MTQTTRVLVVLAASFGAASIFGVLLYRSITADLPRPSIVSDDAPASDPADPVQDNQRFLNDFVQDVSGGRFDSAYAKMAPTYREANTVEHFKAACAASPYLSSATKVTVTRIAGGKAVTDAWIDTATHGTYPMTAFVSSEGGQPRVLVLAIAGVPVLQGITSPVPAGASAKHH
jgi:hypothetical protein